MPDSPSFDGLQHAGVSRVQSMSGSGKKRLPGGCVERPLSGCMGAKAQKFHKQPGQYGGLSVNFKHGLWIVPTDVSYSDHPELVHIRQQRTYPVWLDVFHGQLQQALYPRQKTQTGLGLTVQMGEFKVGMSIYQAWSHSLFSQVLYRG